MKNLFNRKSTNKMKSVIINKACVSWLLEILLLMFCCPIALAQISYIKYNGTLCEVRTYELSFIVKAGYYNDAFLEIFNEPPYYPTYSFVSTNKEDRSVVLRINGRDEEINVLEHYLKFEKENYVEKVIPRYPVLTEDPSLKKFALKGQVIQDGKPLPNYLVNVIHNNFVNISDGYYYISSWNSITDEDGYYIYPEIPENNFTLSLKMGNGKYDTTFVLDEDKILDFNIDSINFPWDLNEALRRVHSLNSYGMYYEAMDICKNILSTTKENLYIAQTLTAILVIYRATQDIEILEFLRNYSINVGNSFGKMAYANALNYGGYIDEALAAYEEIVEKFPNTREEIVALISQSYIYYIHKKNVIKARELLAQVEKLAGKDDVAVGALRSVVMWDLFDIGGRILQDGKPLEGINVALNGDGSTSSSTTGSDGSYIFPKMVEKHDYTISFQIGNNRYDTTFVLDENMTLNFNIGAMIGINDPEEIPTVYSLSQNYPNPFNPTTTIQYAIPKDEFVKLNVYDITGRVVKELVNGYKSVGKYSVEFNASSYASGTYYYKIEAGEYKSIQKMMLVK